MARGNVRKRTSKDGATSYQVRVELTPDPATGKRRTRAGTFATEKEAEKARTKWLGEADEGAVVLPSKIVMRDLCRRWLDDEAATHVRPTTLAGYRATVEGHVIPLLGSVPAQRLTVADVQRFRTEMVAKGSPRVAQLALLRLKQILSWGVAAELLPRNVAAGVKAPVSKAAERTTWTKAQARAFLAEAEKDTYNPLWLVLLTTGLRRGEALGLRWRDLDLDAGRLSVRQSVVILGGKKGEKSRPVIQEPKSKAAKRTIDLDPATVASLRAHKDRQAFRRKKATVWYDNDLVFCTASGAILNPNNVLRNFAALVNVAGVPTIGVHDLRHTHATFLLLDGVPLKVVSERLGHAKTSITLDTYAHVLPGFQHLAVESIGAALFGKTEMSSFASRRLPGSTQLVPRVSKGR